MRRRGRPSVRKRLAFLEKSGPLPDAFLGLASAWFFSEAPPWTLTDDSAYVDRTEDRAALLGRLRAVPTTPTTKKLASALPWLLGQVNWHLRAAGQDSPEGREANSQIVAWSVQARGIRDWFIGEHIADRGLRRVDTLESTRAEANAWHQMLMDPSAVELGRVRIPPELLLRTFSHVWLDFGDGWSWREVPPKTVGRMSAYMQVGRDLGHCYRYADTAADYLRPQEGLVVLFDSHGRPRVTVEVTHAPFGRRAERRVPWVTNQILGVQNRAADPKYAGRIRALLGQVLSDHDAPWRGYAFNYFDFSTLPLRRQIAYSLRFPKTLVSPEGKAAADRIRSWWETIPNPGHDDGVRWTYDLVAYGRGERRLGLGLHELDQAHNLTGLVVVTASVGGTVGQKRLEAGLPQLAARLNAMRARGWRRRVNRDGRSPYIWEREWRLDRFDVDRVLATQVAIGRKLAAVSRGYGWLRPVPP